MKIVISQKSLLEKQLDFQEVARMNISDKYYTSAIDFIARMYSTELATEKNLAAFPDVFRDYIASKGLKYHTIFGNGSIKVAVMKIKSAEHDLSGESGNRKSYELLIQIIKDVKEELGFAATFEYSRDKRYHIVDEYIACFPGRVTKNETGQWVPVTEEGGAAKFFALLVARGFVEEALVLEDGMATLGVAGLKFREHFLQALAQFKQRGLQKIIETPLHVRK